MYIDANQPEHWRDMKDAPRDGTEVVLRMPRPTMGDHYRQYGAWIEDDGGTNPTHPPLKGWFRATQYGYEDLHEPAGWLPVDISEQDNDMLRAHADGLLSQLATNDAVAYKLRRLANFDTIGFDLLANAAEILHEAAGILNPGSAGSADSDAVAKSEEEIDRYITTCLQLSDKGEYQWWSRLAVLLMSTRMPEGWIIAPAEPTLDMVMAGENAHDDQLCKRLDDKSRKSWPSEESTELATRVSYRVMMAKRPLPPVPKRIAA